MRLKIITHEKVVFDEDVDEIYTKGVDGEFGILKNHVPVMSALDIGVTKAVQNNQPVFLQQWAEFYNLKMMSVSFLLQLQNAVIRLMLPGQRKPLPGQSQD